MPRADDPNVQEGEPVSQPVREYVRQQIAVLDGEIRNREKYTLHADLHDRGSRDPIRVAALSGGESLASAPCYDFILDSQSTASGNRYNSFQDILDQIPIGTAAPHSIWVCPGHEDPDASVTIAGMRSFQIYGPAGFTDGDQAYMFLPKFVLTGGNYFIDLNNVQAEFSFNLSGTSDVDLWLRAEGCDIYDWERTLGSAPGNYVQVRMSYIRNTVFWGKFDADAINDSYFEQVNFLDGVLLRDVFNVTFQSCEGYDDLVTSGNYSALFAVEGKFNGLFLRGCRVIYGSGSPSTPAALLYFKTANADVISGSTTALSNEGFAVTGCGYHSEVSGASPITYYLVASEAGTGTAPADGAVQGNFATEGSTTGVMRGAIGPFQDTTFGPNAPDNLDYTGVTGTGNAFYTSGVLSGQASVAAGGFSFGWAPTGVSK